MIVVEIIYDSIIVDLPHQFYIRIPSPKAAGPFFAFSLAFRRGEMQPIYLWPMSSLKVGHKNSSAKVMDVY